MDLPRIMEISLGNCAQRALCVALKKDLFTRIGNGLVAKEEAAHVLECDPRPARILCDVLVSLGLLIRDGENLRASHGARRFLSSTSPDYTGDFILMLDERLYHLWEGLEDTVARNRPQAASFDGAALTPEEIHALTRRAIMGLHGITTVAARALAEKVTLRQGSRHLDLGGGTGALCITLARAFPDVRFIIIDQGPVLAVARENIEAAGLLPRFDLLERNFFTDEYPHGVDSVSLSNILHDWSREEGMELLRRAHRALAPGGMIIINEWLLHDSREGPLSAALLSLNMLLETPGGENFSAAQIAGMLEEAGFAEPWSSWTEPPHGIVVAHKRGTAARY
jgi:predicted O-methyltransferase YrrM